MKHANELVSFIRSRGVTLTQRGKQLVGLCPFHDDHEPSLVVDAKKQLWNCLGACREGGDVYRFVMKADGVDFREAHRRLGGNEAEAKSVAVEDQQWLERAVDHDHARLLETPAAQDYLRSRGITASEFVTSFRVGYSDGTLAEKLPAEGRKALRRVGVLTGSRRELLRGCLVFPLVAAVGQHSGHVVDLYGRSIEGRRHLFLPGERRGVFNSQGARNTDEVIITESVIDAAALWSVGLRNVIPTYGTTGLTEEIIAHLVECRVKRVVLMLDADAAGRAAAIEMTERLAAVNIAVRSVEFSKSDLIFFLLEISISSCRCWAAMNAMNESQSQRLKLMAECFSEWLEAINYSPKTRVNYTRDVKLFLTWLSENTIINSIVEVTPAQLQQYQIWLYNFTRNQDNGNEATKAKEAKRLSVGTQANRLAAMRKFFSWLLSEQQIAYNPASTLQLPKQPQRLPRGVLTKTEARRLIEATPTTKPRDVRDRAILETLYATGFRRAELLALTIYDADLQTATLRVEHGKGNTKRVVPLTQSAIAALKLYLEEARALFAHKAGQVRLFVSSRSVGPLDDDDIVRIVAKASTRAGIRKHVTPHTLRHTCATHLLKGRADIRQIQKLLGHRRLSSTEVYTRVELSDLAEVIARCHPREKRK